MKLRVSRRADADIQEIAEYTVMTWGEEQADVYVGGLWSLMTDLAARGARGHATEGLPRSIRREAYEFHFIFFEHRRTEFLVARVLHHKMDIFRHLI